MSNTNHDVAHLWANQSKPHARSSNGNFSFDGDTIYSYSTPIARLVRDELGEIVSCLRTTEKFSITTSSKHETAISYALPHSLPAIFVPDLGYRGIEPRHERNLEYFTREIGANASKARRSLQNAEWLWRQVQRLVTNGNEYRHLFHLNHPEFVMPDDWRDSLAKSQERVHRIENPDPESADRRERERARRIQKKNEQNAEAARQYQIRLAEQIDEWKAGRGSSYLPGAPMMLRLRPGHPDTLETSKGAHVPLSDAIRIFQMAQGARSASTAWYPKGLCRPRAGDFHLDGIDADGTIHAGCHTIPWEESERMAREIGVLELA